MNDHHERTPSAKALGVSEAAIARVELYNTLGDLRDRLNYSQRVDDALEDAKVRLDVLRRTRPVVFVAGCAGAATAAGLVVWGVARRVSRGVR